jgi:hypothetical protein
MQKIDITDKELLGFIGKQESQEIGAFNSYGDRLLKQLEGGTGLVGDKLPWSKTHNAVRLDMVRYQWSRQNTFTE